MTIPIRYGSVELDIEELEHRANDMRQRAAIGPMRLPSPDGRSVNGLPKTRQELLREEAEREYRTKRHKEHNMNLALMCEECIGYKRQQRNRLL